MIKKQKKRIVFATAACLAAACVSVGVWNAELSSAKAEYVTPDYYSETYKQGEEISLSSKKITYDGKEYDASVLVIAPDGKGYDGANCLLSQAGIYTVEYRFNVDGKTVILSETFTVLQPLYEVTSQRSSIEYTSYTDAVGDNSLTSEGVLVNLAPNDEFVYNKIIDVSDNTQYDKLLGLFMIPQKKGMADLYQLDVTFTDVYDSSNYVTVTFKTGEKKTDNLISGKHYYEYISYMSACATNQLTTGIDQNDKGTFLYNGKMYYKWVRHPQYGYMFRTSFYGTDATVKYKVDAGIVIDQWLEYVPTGSREMEVYLDYANKQIHGASTTPNPTTLVCDLDDTAFFSEVWKGFTTGEVKMSIRGANYVSSTAQFMITGIDGQELSSEKLKDDVAPQLSVDTQGYEEKSLPQARKGLPYKIFPAKAVDNYDGDVEVVTNVYYNYNASNQINVGMEDGAFVPTQNGKYAVVYTAVDSLGNTSKKVLYVNCNSDKVLQIQVDQTTATATVGRSVSVPNYTVTGNAGNVVNSIIATHKTQNVQYEVKDGAFVPMYAGEYEIAYTCSDYLETKTEKITLTVENTEEPVILDEITMPKYLLKNCIYRLPTLTGYVFENGMPTEKETSVSVTENGTTRTLTNNYFAPQASGNVSVIYTVKNGEYSFSKTFALTVVDVGYGERIAMENYFIGDMTAEATSRYVEISASENTTSYFAMPLQVLEFKANFQIDVNKNAFEKMTVRLHDVNDETVSVAFHFINTPEGTQFSVNNDSFIYSLGYDAFRSSMESLTLNYYAAKRQVTFDESTFVTVETDENGKPFNGFSDNVAYMSCSVDGVAQGGEAGIQVAKINEQPFNNSITDKIKPQLFLENRDSGLKQTGDEIYIAPAYAFDVLDPRTALSFSVYDPDGKVCVSTDGVKLDATADYSRSYKVKAEKLGSYVVRYQVADGKGNKLTDSYAIKVVDKTPPVIEVMPLVATAAVGDKIFLNKATATDNLTENPAVRTYLYDPNGSMEEVTGKTEFTATLKGVYRVTYMAIDGLNNVAFKTFTIIVS